MAPDSHLHRHGRSGFALTLRIGKGGILPEGREVDAKNSGTAKDEEQEER